MDTRSLRRCFYPQWFEPPALILARPRCREGIDANAKRNLFVLRVCLPLLLVLAARSVVRGVDWSACASDLDDVHQASDDATDAAQEADEAQQELESQRSNVESCSDDCESERSDYEDAKDDFEEKSASAENELDNLDLKIRGASASCGYDLRFSRTGPVAPHCSASQRSLRFVSAIRRAVATREHSQGLCDFNVGARLPQVPGYREMIAGLLADQWDNLYGTTNFECRSSCQEKESEAIN